MIKRTVLAAFVTCLAAPSIADNRMEEIMIGNWESIACEVRPQPNQDGTMGEWWLTRKLTLADGRIDAEFTTYAGPGCGFALQRLDFGGQVEIVGDSDVVAGAVEADLTIDDYVRITPLSDGFVEFLNSAPAGTCGETSWSVGETQDILETGCSVLGLQGNDPTVEYEVLAVQDGYIYFGARPTDGSFITSANKRPQALLVPAKRIEE